jgi:hypothetical protein
VSTKRREGLVYGLGALHAAARGDRMMWALHRAALANGIVPLVPAVTVAEGYRTEARNGAVVAQRQPVLRTASNLLGHELVLYTV